MEVEKRGVKGGFFQLFDWNAKSRKKFFSSKSEAPESSNPGKENYHVPFTGKSQLMLERVSPSNVGGWNSYRYASPATVCSENGTTAPGVVARLMGLDSLPTPSANEPCSNPYLETGSFRDSSYLMTAATFPSEHDIVILSDRNKLDGSSRNPLELRLNKVPSRPIERFQMETLPPKSAKPISVTQHRLMPPIKSAGFAPPKNAAYIIEAAAKMIEQSTHSTMKGSMMSTGSSVPLRIRDLKEKMEAAERSSRSIDTSIKGKELSSLKTLSKQLNVRGQGRSDDSYLYRNSEGSRRLGSQRMKSKEKPVSLAVQAKTSIHRRDALMSVGSRSSEKQKEHIKPSSSSRNLHNPQKRVEKQNSSIRAPEVLRLNNQKQNCASSEDEEKFEFLCSHQKESKNSNLSTNYAHGRKNRTIHKIAVSDVITSRKANVLAADPGNELSSLRAKTSSKKKLPISENINISGSAAQKATTMKAEKSLKTNGSEGDSRWDEMEKRNSLDVVSFTFTSPIKKSVAGPSSRDPIFETVSSTFPSSNPCQNESDLRNSDTSSSGINAIGGDALSMLLEQKLRELTSRVVLSEKDQSEAGTFSSSANSLRDACSSVNFVKHMPSFKDILANKEDIQNSSDCTTINGLWLSDEEERKGLECTKSFDDSCNIERQRYLNFQGSISTSGQPSFHRAASDAFQGEGSPTIEGMEWSSIRNFHPAEAEWEISDTTSTMSVGTVSETLTSSLYIADSKDTSSWEVQYIWDILGVAEIFLEEFARGQVERIISPDLFDQLENRKMNLFKTVGGESPVQRKLLFDCVCECLEIRLGVLPRSYKIWSKNTSILHRKHWLAVELYKEISCWENSEELMVDELVEKDMSSGNGKWIDFEGDAFEEGVEIEERILTSLVDELVDDSCCDALMTPTPTPLSSKVSC